MNEEEGSDGDLEVCVGEYNQDGGHGKRQEGEGDTIMMGEGEGGRRWRENKQDSGHRGYKEEAEAEVVQSGTLEERQELGEGGYNKEGDFWEEGGLEWRRPRKGREQEQGGA